MRPLQHVQHAVPGALVELLRGTPLSDGKVSFAWQAAVGPALARATAVKLEHGVLIVETPSAQWAREVQRSHGVILSRLRPLLGADTVMSITTRAPKP
jgi:predicted nucleic acid-binding Zn ribbon protein